MRLRLSGPVAAVLLLAVASVPCPADTINNVGVEDILAPNGTIDSGQTIIPRCVVANHGDSTAALWAFFTIEDGTPQGYLDSLYLPALAPAQRETLEYQPWIPRGRDSMTAIAWTVCTGDTFPDNDTCRRRFFVRVKDVAALAIIRPVPDTTYDSGVTFYPQCLVWDYGNCPWDTVIVRFRIGTYISACTLDEGHGDTATAPDPYTAMPGIWACQAFAVAPGDLHPDNNLKVDTFTVTGEGIYRDVAVTRAWQDSFGNAAFEVANLGVDFESFWAFLTLRESAGVLLYAESTQFVSFAPGDSSELGLNIRISIPGLYVAACSVDLYGDQDSTNNVKYVWFRVPSGITEESTPRFAIGNARATVVRALPRGAVALDATGRRVLNPKSGILFVAEYSVVSSQHSGTADGARNTVRVRKVILQR